MGVDIKNSKDITEIKNRVIENSSKGFGYFIKNILLILGIGIGLFVVSNFNTLMTAPETLLNNISPNVFWIIGILLLISCGIYQLGCSIAKSNKTESNKEFLNDYKKAEQEKQREDEELHANYLRKRIKNSPKISLTLKDILINLGASRACIAEMHNGTNNLNGLPFIFFDVSYEEVNKEVEHIADQFTNFNMVKFPFITNHFSDGTYIGSVDEIEQEDKYLAKKFKDVQAEYGAAVVIRGIDGPLGFLTATFTHKEDAPSKIKIIAEMNQAAQIISTLLDKE